MVKILLTINHHEYCLRSMTGGDQWSVNSSWMHMCIYFLKVAQRCLRGWCLKSYLHISWQTRPDTRQSSCGCLGRSSNAKTACNAKMLWMDRQTNKPRWKVECPRMKKKSTHGGSSWVGPQNFLRNHPLVWVGQHYFATKNLIRTRVVLIISFAYNHQCNVTGK